MSHSIRNILFLSYWKSKTIDTPHLTYCKNCEKNTPATLTLNYKLTGYNTPAAGPNTIPAYIAERHYFCTCLECNTAKEIRETPELNDLFDSQIAWREKHGCALIIIITALIMILIMICGIFSIVAHW